MLSDCTSFMPSPRPPGTYAPCRVCGGTGKDPKKRKRACVACRRHPKEEANICLHCGKAISGCLVNAGTDYCSCYDVPRGSI